jgi:hypothetical protein
MLTKQRSFLDSYPNLISLSCNLLSEFVSFFLCHLNALNYPTSYGLTREDTHYADVALALRFFLFISLLLLSLLTLVFLLIP